MFLRDIHLNWFELRLFFTVPLPGPNDVTGMVTRRPPSVAIMEDGRLNTFSADFSAVLMSDARQNGVMFPQ